MRLAFKVVVPIAVVAAAAAAMASVARHRHGHAIARSVAGGVLVGNATAYDRITGWLLGGFYDGVAADVGVIASSGASVLDVGCGPGHLTRRLEALGLDATGIDLDPAMIERAAARGPRDGATGRYLAADVAALPFEDGTFDVVVSTLSMHHWADAEDGLAEIGRVVRPGGRVLVWDLGRGAPLHKDPPDPLQALRGSALEVVAVTPWRWPGPLSFVQRIELVPATLDSPAATAALGAHPHRH